MLDKSGKDLAQYRLEKEKEDAITQYENAKKFVTEVEKYIQSLEQ